MEELTKRVSNDAVLEGRFIQVYINKRPYLKMGNEDSLHGILLLNFLIESGISPQMIDDDANCWSPAPKGDNYELVGAGLVDGGEGEFVLYGKSKSYSTLKPNQKHLDALFLHLPRGIKFTIDHFR